MMAGADPQPPCLPKTSGNCCTYIALGGCGQPCARLVKPRGLLSHQLVVVVTSKGKSISAMLCFYGSSEYVLSLFYYIVSSPRVWRNLAGCCTALSFSTNNKHGGFEWHYDIESRKSRWYRNLVTILPFLCPTSSQVVTYQCLE